MITTTTLSTTTTAAPAKAETYEEAALEKSKKHGLVFLHLLNEGYVEMTRSWICNVLPFKTVLEKTLFLVTDQNAYEKLKNWKPELNVFLVPYDTPKSMQYGQKVYYQYMQFRTRLYLKLLKAGVKLWIVEADAVWFKDPASFVLNEPDYDLLTGQDGGLGDNIPEAGFLFLNPTPTTVKMWTALESQLTRTLDSSRDANMGDGGSEMLMLGDMLRGSKEIKWKYLPNKHFCGGKWYQGGPLKQQSDPVVIQVSVFPPHPLPSFSLSPPPSTPSPQPTPPPTEQLDHRKQCKNGAGKTVETLVPSGRWEDVYEIVKLTCPTSQHLPTS